MIRLEVAPMNLAAALNADYALVTRRLTEALPTPRSIIPAQSTLTVTDKPLLVARPDAAL
jgi:hypothetical protein